MAPKTPIVSDIMTQGVLTLSPNLSVNNIDELMKSEHIHHVPVVDDDDGSLVGIVSQRDIFINALVRAAGYASQDGQMLKQELFIREVMHKDPVTIGPDEPVYRAASLMRTNKISCLPVVDSDKLIGIVTSSDLIDWVAAFLEGEELDEEAGAVE